MSVPSNPKIYHILPLDRLGSVFEAGCLYSDQIMSQREDTGTKIGMQRIKARRLQLPVGGNPPGMVGEHVPFYFCPRSVMLFVISCNDNPDLAYRGGQEPIVHLQADLRSVIDWANANKTPWAFSLSNAGAAYTEFCFNEEELNKLNWDAIHANDWRDPKIKEGKQAEFLVRGQFPVSLFERIGVYSESVGRQVLTIIRGQESRPVVSVCKGWYY